VTAWKTEEGILFLPPPPAYLGHKKQTLSTTVTKRIIKAKYDLYTSKEFYLR
jgi:hypothetical protein